MLLLTEQTEDVELITEESNGTKNYYISGPFMVAESLNGNKRVYPKSVLEQEMIRYQPLISEKRSLGELGHPSNPTLNLDRVSHLITELKMDGNIVYGKAKILDTPTGKIAKNFLDEGIRLGVSSRGLGSIKESNGMKVVQPDFKLMTVDIVSEPSGPGCYVESLMENVEWIFDGLSWQRKEQLHESMKQVKKVSNKKERETLFLEQFHSMLNTITEGKTTQNDVNVLNQYGIKKQPHVAHALKLIRQGHSHKQAASKTIDKFPHIGYD